MSAVVSTQAFYFEKLIEEGRIGNKLVQVVSAEPSDVFSMLQSPSSDLCAILCFPHYSLHEVFYSVRYLDGAPDGLTDNFLCFSGKLATDEKLMRLVSIAIRNAWLLLLEQPALIGSVVDELFSQEDYIKVIFRTCGLSGSNFFEQAYSEIPT